MSLYNWNEELNGGICETPEKGPLLSEGDWEPSINLEDTIDLDYCFEIIANYRTFIPTRPIIDIDFSDICNDDDLGLINNKFDQISVIKLDDRLFDSDGDSDTDSDSDATVENDTKENADFNLNIVNENTEKNTNSLDFDFNFNFNFDFDFNQNGYAAINDSNIGHTGKKVKELVENDCHLPIVELLFVVFGYFVLHINDVPNVFLVLLKCL